MIWINIYLNIAIWPIWGFSAIRLAAGRSGAGAGFEGYELGKGYICGLAKQFKVWENDYEEG